MFLLYRQMRHPTTVDACITARFTSPNADEIILSRVNTLEIWSHDLKKQITTFDLHGEINGVQKLQLSSLSLSPVEARTIKSRMPEPGLDCLVLTFDEAKISIVSFDPTHPRVLRTIALYNFESLSDQPGRFPTGSSTFGAKAVPLVDPMGRAVASLIFSSLLVIIPIRTTIRNDQEELLDEPLIDEDSFETRPDIARKKGHLFKHPTNNKECGQDHPLFIAPHIIPLARYGIPEHTARDACFLHHQQRATLSILYSLPLRSWAPRFSVVRDSCAVTSICIVPESPLTSPLVSSFQGLPYDSNSILPVPHRAGGVLIASTNAIQYLGPSPSKRWSLCVNGFAISSVFCNKVAPLHDLSGRPLIDNKTDVQQSDAPLVAFDLDGSRFCWVQDDLVLIALSRGELLEIRIDHPEGRETCLYGRLLGAAGPFSCLTSLRINVDDANDEGIVFLGSRQGDSLLLHWERPFDPVLSKRAKFEDAEEEFLYGNELAPVSNRSEPIYEVLDTLPAFAPMTDFEFADSLSTAPRNVQVDAESEDQAALKVAEEQAQELMKQNRFSAAANVRVRAQNSIAERRKARANLTVPRDLDFVACGPRARQGASVCVMHSGMRSDLCAEIAVNDCGGMWSVETSLQGKLRRILVWSDGSKTKMLGMTEEDGILKVIQDSVLGVEEATLLVHQGTECLFQVLVDEIRLIKGDNVVDSIKHDMKLSTCCGDGNFVLLLSAEGKLSLFTVKSSKLSVLPCVLTSLHANSIDGAACCTLFRDFDGNQNLGIIRGGCNEPGAGVFELYRVVESSSLVPTFKSQVAVPLCAPLLQHCFDDSLIEHLTVKDAGVAAGVLANARVVDMQISMVGANSLTKPTRQSHQLVLACALGDGEVVLYCQREDSTWARVDHGVITRGLRGRASRPRKFAFPNLSPSGRQYGGPLLSKFRNVGGNDGIFFCGHRPMFVVAGKGLAISLVPLANTVSAPLPPPLLPPLNQQDEHKKPTVPSPNDFNKIRGCIHVFCALDMPSSLSQGFVYALRAPEPRVPSQGPLKSTALRFCRITTMSHRDFGVDGIPATKHKLPSGWCATKLCYLPQASRGGPEELQLSLHAPTYVMLTSRDILLEPNEEDLYEDDEKELKPDLRIGGAPGVMGQSCAIELVRAPEWHRCLSSFPLEEDERALCVTSGNLNVPSDLPGNQPTASNSQQRRPQSSATSVPRVTRPGLILVGTGRIARRGEEGFSTGRLLVFEVEHARDSTLSEAQAEAMRRLQARPATVPQLRLIASTDQKGPISALCVLEGKVLAAMGNIPSSVKLMELNPQSERLVPVGFYDSPTCVVSMSVVKDQYILLADMYRNVHFLRWRDRQFTVWARSFEPTRVFSSEFLVDGLQLGITACDEEGNLRLWHFDPENQKQVLSVRGEIHLGDRVTRMKTRRIIPLPPLATTNDSSVMTDGGTMVASSASSTPGFPPPPSSLPSQQLQRWSLTFGTLGGAVGALIPIDEKVYRRLDLLQNAMIANPLVPRNAGLNPKEEAAARLSPMIQRKRKTNVIDGRLIWRFLYLERVTQRKVALSIGSTVETICDDLLLVDLMLTW